MALARTALGTQSAKTGTTLTLSVTLATGDLLVVGLHGKASGTSSVKWNGIAMSQATASQGFNTTGISELWYFKVVSGATANLVATFSSTLTNGGSMWASKVTGHDTSSPIDAIANNDWASSTAATSTATGTTAQPNEILFGQIGDEGPSTDGSPTWSNSFNAGQRVGTSGGTATNNSTSNEGYLIVSSTGAYTAAATLATARAGAACIVTIKQLVAPSTLGLLMGVG